MLDKQVAVSGLSDVSRQPFECYRPQMQLLDLFRVFLKSRLLLSLDALALYLLSAVSVHCVYVIPQFVEFSVYVLPQPFLLAGRRAETPSVQRHPILTLDVSRENHDAVWVLRRRHFSLTMRLRS